MASGPGISGNLEKSGNFVMLLKSQGIVKEFREIGKSQGILTQNWVKSKNFTCMKRISPKFFKIHSSGEQELVTPVHVSCMLLYI